MAKQKAKDPAAGPGRELPEGTAKAVPGATPKRKISPKRKVKNARKGKARSGADLATSEAPRLAVRPKRLRKATRKKAPTDAKAADTFVSKVFDGLAGALPAVARKRKPGRPGAPLGRLERLEIAMSEVRVGGRASVRTRKLLAAGVPKMAQKVIEEAAETAIEAVRGDRVAFVHESVDLFYNLLALASEIGVPLAAIWAEMDRREQVLGMAEKLPKAPDP